jgi:hypothetical protein
MLTLSFDRTPPRSTCSHEQEATQGSVAMTLDAFVTGSRCLGQRISCFEAVPSYPARHFIVVASTRITMLHASCEADSHASG